MPVFRFLNNSKELDPSYEMDLDFLELFWKEKTLSYNRTKTVLHCKTKLFHSWSSSVFVFGVQIFRSFTDCTCVCVSVCRCLHANLANIQLYVHCDHISIKCSVLIF